jgi:hypothetical protein
VTNISKSKKKTFQNSLQVASKAGTLESEVALHVASRVHFSVSYQFLGRHFLFMSPKFSPLGYKVPNTPDKSFIPAQP